MILNEDMFENANTDLDIHIYYDESTGTEYVYRGGKLVPLPKPDFDDEDEEREKQIEREEEEARNRGLTVNKETPEEREERIRRLTDVMENSADAFKKESESKAKANKVSSKSQKEQQRRLERTVNAKPIAAFERSLTSFIKKQCQEVDPEFSYKRLSKKYSTSNLVKPGMKRPEQEVPLLVAYLDRSGSWGPSDTAVAEKVINSLSTYVKQGKLIIQLKEFADEVVNYGEGYPGGGTKGTPIIEDIIKTKPDNVVIMTDGDIDDMRTSVTVDGGVWLIFKQTFYYRGSEAYVDKNVIDHVRGKKRTEVFKIPWEY